MRRPWLLLVMGTVLFISTLPSQDRFPQVHGLPVRNYGLSMKWDYFQEAFIGVQHTNPLDVALYSILNGHTSGGVCFGMSALTGVVHDEGGYMGLCSPLSAYTPKSTVTGHDTLGVFWPQMRTAIMVLWSRQFSTEVIRIIVEAISNHYFTDPKMAFEKADYYQSSNEIPILCISQSSVPGSFGGMHAIYPYKFEKTSTDWKMYVYDPSQPYFARKSFFEHDSNCVHIDPMANTWSYSWPTLSFSGFIYAVPARRLLLPTSNPLLLSDLASNVGSFFINGGKITSIEDHTTGLVLTKDDLFVKGNGSAIIRWLPISGRLTNGEMFIFTGLRNHKLTINIQSDRDSVYIVSANGREVLETNATGKGLNFSIAMEKTGTSDQVIALKSLNSDFDAEMTLHYVFSRDNINSFRLEKTSLGAGEEFTAAYKNDGNAIALSGNFDKEVYLTFLKFNGEEQFVAGKMSISINSGKLAIAKPFFWSKEKLFSLTNK